MNIKLVLKLILAMAAAGWGAGCAIKSDEAAPGHAPLPAVPAADAPPALSEQVAQALAVPPAPFVGEGWQSLFDGQHLGNWREINYAGRGEVRVESGCLLLDMGSPFTGVRWTNSFPTDGYEIAFDAMRTLGSDFFCGLTVPVGNSHCTFIVGGWGGGLVGLSNLDGYDASENETTRFMNFDTGRWYRIRLRVTAERLEAWIDQDKLVSVARADRDFSLRPGDIELSAPLGISAWQTGAALREIRWRKVTAPDSTRK
ncbi:MAG TPA: DUF1080 domain-containing protein [Verrucomicrobiota bacterium]|nr:DUF1080 domain-containing protein [Verrucomicrobiota bacterium]HQB17116.1 DUF1080 domain-containing protein [Verrucomicrobiota bacterium]